MEENKDYTNLTSNYSNKTTNKPIISKSSSNTNELKSNKAENKWTKMLLEFFTTINSIDNQIEKIRSKLNYTNNFSSSDLFNYLDKNSKKFLTLNDFKSFLQSIPISFAEKNLRQFIHNFDKDNDFSINFKEFVGIISPKKVGRLILGEEAPPKGGEGKKKIDEDIKKIFGELIIEELKYVEKCYELSQNIRNSKEFTTYEAFTEIVGEEKYINVNNLGKYIKDKGLNMTDVEINQLMFRIDSDNDGMISYEEFKEIFLPLNDIDFKYKDYNNDDYMKYFNDKSNNSYEINNKNKLEFNYNKNEKSYKIDLPLKLTNIKINKNLNNKENKENNKNEINIKQRYNSNSNTDNIEHKENTDLKDKNFLYENEDLPNMSYSLYDDKLYDKSISIDAQKFNKIKEKDKNLKKYSQRNSSNSKLTLNHNKNISNCRKKSKNNLIYATQSILNYSNNENKKEERNNNTEIYNEINDYKIKKNMNKINNNINNIMKTPINKEQNSKKQIYKNKGQKFLDTYLNFDYSIYTNKDRDNGQYYFKQKSKYNISDPTGKNTIEENKNDNDSKYIKNNFKNYESNKSDYFQNKNIYKDQYIIEKKDMYNREFILDNKNLYKKENIINNNNYILNKNNSNDIIIQKEENIFQKKNYNDNNNEISSPLNHYKVVNNYDKYIANNNYYKKIKNKKVVNNSVRNNYLNYYINQEQNNIDTEKQYLDSLENTDGMKNFKNKIHKNLEKPKKKYHYNDKLTRNLQDEIFNRINNSYKLNNVANNNNTMINYNYNNNNNIYKTFFAKEKRNSNQNRSCIISYKNNNKDFLGIDNEYSNEKYIYKNKSIDKDKDKPIYSLDWSSKRCPKCNCINEDMSPLVEEKKDSSGISNVINNNKNKFSNNKHSSLPKNIFKKTNKLNLNYNNNTNTKSYYLESSYNNNNFIINKLNNNRHYYSNNLYKRNKGSYGINNNSNTYNINNIKSDSFYNLLFDFIKQDNSIENIREALSMREDANLADLFELFDHSSNQLISPVDFLETLKELGFYFNKDEIKYVFRKFNKNTNEYFEFEEFCEIILPKKYSSAKIMNEKDNEYDYEITKETKNIIGLLFKNIIEGEKSNENYRIKIWKNGEYSGFDLFNKIKKSYSIGIYKEDIANFMKKNKYKVSNAELLLLMERFDKNKDGMIDYKEFLNEISPMNEL